jgi:DNA polymerase III alpha subunit (gram-positive type)
MKYIVMDLEFNQHFNFGKDERRGINPSLPFEVIQTGLVKLDESLNVESTLNVMVKPKIYKRMHPFVERLTGITESMFEGEKSFPEVYGEIVGFMGGEDNVFCVWGGSDVKLLYRNISYYKLDSSHITKKYIDVQRMATKHMKLPAGACIGLENAVKNLEIPIGNTFHNALNDAMYTAEIFRTLKNGKTQNGEPPVDTFNIENLSAQAKAKRKAERLFDVEKMLAEAEKMYGRATTKKEKDILKQIYIMGRQNKFGYKNKR